MLKSIISIISIIGTIVMSLNVLKMKVMHSEFFVVFCQAKNYNGNIKTVGGFMHEDTSLT